MKGGEHLVNIHLEVVFSILASVISEIVFYYICKWLDRK